MAETLIGTQLTEAHRIGQIAITQKVAKQLTQIFPLLDLNNLDATQTTWLNLVVEALLSGRRESDALASGYMSAFYQVEAGYVAPVIHDVITEADITRFRNSMELLGPVHVKQLMSHGYALEYAGQSALTAVQKSASRHVQDGGRNVIQSTVENDPLTVGWKRIGVGENCKFCNMLLARGAVYNSQTVRFRSHDNCNCQCEPAWGGEPMDLLQFKASSKKSTPADKKRVKDYLDENGVEGYDKAKNPRKPESAPKKATNVDDKRSTAQLADMRDKLQKSYEMYPTKAVETRIADLNMKISKR